ncbi:MAG: alpha-mannosidase [Planctomycetes bacterium]|nr:alpha-mannosidase [Planctomycetota bacterium]
MKTAVRSLRFPVFACGIAGLLIFAALRVVAARPELGARAGLDDTLERLSRIGKYELKDWRWRHGENSGGADPTLDDSTWKAASPGHSWSGDNTEGWYRKSVDIPAKILGFSTRGPVTLEIGIDDLGEIWVDGKKKQDFLWDQGTVQLTNDAKGGEKFFVAIRAKNQGGPGRLLHARLVFGGLDGVQAKVGLLTEELKVAHKITESFGGGDAKWNGIVEKAGSRVDFAAAERGDEQQLYNSLESAEKELSNLKELTKDYKIRCAGYSHIDLAWLWRWRESVQVTKETFQSAINFMKEYPDFRFSMSQSHAYRWMEDKYPELFGAMKGAIRDGKWEIVGGTAVELDCNLPDAESQIRQIALGQRYFQDKFGKRAKIGWCPDSFGYNANLPQILKKSGMDYFVTAKISWNDTNKFPHNLFWWESPDGSRVLTFLPMGGYTNDLQPEPMLDYLKEVEQQTGYKEILMVYGVGNHGGGPTREMIEREKRLEQMDFYPKIQKSTAIDYFDNIPKEAREKLPAWKDELYLEFHRGTYTTQAANKRANRKGEVGLVTAEKLASLAALYGEPYPYEDFAKAWDYLLFNQMHDILPGSSITPVYRDSAEDYARMFAIVDKIIQKSLQKIPLTAYLLFKIEAAGLETAVKNGEREVPLGIMVFNPLSWDRNSIATVEWNDANYLNALMNVDVRGKGATPVSAQIIKDESGRQHALFIANDVPALGVAGFALTKQLGGPHKAPSIARSVTVAEVEQSNAYILENQHLKVTIDRASGNIRNIIHKQTGRDALAGEGNRIQLLEDKPKQYDAWELGFTGKQWDLDKAAKVEITERGPVRVTVKITKTFLGDTKAKRKPTEDFPSSFFTQEVSLYDNIPWVETRFTADWWEDHICAKVAFPLSVKPDKATYEVPYATIERSTKRDTPWEKARYEVPAQKWADMTEGDFGVSIINEAKYGYDALDNVIRLTCFRAPASPDPTADRGHHQFSYAIYPHSGDWRSGGTVRAAYEFNNPLVSEASPTFGETWGGTSFSHYNEFGVGSHLKPGSGGAPDPLDGKHRNDAKYPAAPAKAVFTKEAATQPHSLVQCSAPNVIINVVKWADADDAMIVRFYESTGAAKTSVKLTFPFEIASAEHVNLLEENPTPLAIDNKSAVTLDVASFSIETVKIKPVRK